MKVYITPTSEGFHKRDYETAGLKFGVMTEMPKEVLEKDEKIQSLLRLGIVKKVFIGGGEPTVKQKRPRRERENTQI